MSGRADRQTQVDCCWDEGSDSKPKFGIEVRTVELEKILPHRSGMRRWDVSVEAQYGLNSVGGETDPLQGPMTKCLEDWR